MGNRILKQTLTESSTRNILENAPVTHPSEARNAAVARLNQITAEPAIKMDVKQAAELARSNMELGNQILITRRVDSGASLNIINKDLKASGIDLESRGKRIGEQIGKELEHSLVRGLDYMGLNFDPVVEASRMAGRSMSNAADAAAQTALEPLGLRAKFIFQGSMKGIKPHGNVTMTLGRAGASTPTFEFKANEQGELGIRAKRGPISLTAKISGDEVGAEVTFTKSATFSTYVGGTEKEPIKGGLSYKF